MKPLGIAEMPPYPTIQNMMQDETLENPLKSPYFYPLLSAVLQHYILRKIVGTKNAVR
jgi:hypothetical protein